MGKNEGKNKNLPPLEITLFELKIAQHILTSLFICLVFKKVFESLLLVDD